MSDRAVNILKRIGGEKALDVSGVVGPLTDTTSTQAIAAQGADKYIYVTAIMATNKDASTGALVKILSGSTVKWQGWAEPSGGGFAINFTKPLKMGANEAVNVQLDASPASGVYASINGIVLTEF